ncbi:MAG: SRPBCC family protein [Solirubrobacteraceae bacterium]
MPVVKASIFIAAPPERVWALVMDPERLDEWVTIHSALIRHDTGPIREGYTMEQQVHVRGVKLDVRWRLAECLPVTCAVWKGRGPARSTANSEYRLLPKDGGTLFDYRNEFHAPLGVLGAVASRALVGGVPEREAHLTLEKLRSLFE